MINKKKEIIDSLYNIGYVDEEVKLFISEYENGNKQNALNILSVKRKEVLEQCHNLERSISCIDYLTFIINSEQ